MCVSYISVAYFILYLRFAREKNGKKERDRQRVWLVGGGWAFQPTKNWIQLIYTAWDIFFGSLHRRSTLDSMWNIETLIQPRRHSQFQLCTLNIAYLSVQCTEVDGTNDTMKCMSGFDQTFSHFVCRCVNDVRFFFYLNDFNQFE